MELYYISLQQIEKHMRSQFDETEERQQPARTRTRREQPSASARARLAIGAALYRLATAIDPATPVPSRPH